jgi:molecular chaperone DnaK
VARTHASDDEVKRKEVETRNKLDGLIYQTEKLINENREKLPETEIGNAAKVVTEAKAALEDGGVERMETAHESLTQASHQVAAALYRSTTEEGQPTSGNEEAAGSEPSSSGDEEVIDAEYVDVDAEESK